MQARHPRIVGGLLARLAHHDLDLGAALRHRLLDPTGVDPSVGDELGERHARHLATHRIEAGQHDGLGGVVDDEIDTSGLLERSNVPAFAPDDPALHLLGRQADDGHRRLAGVIGGDALHDRGQHPPGALVTLLGCPALDLADAVLGFGLRLVNDLLDE